MYGSLNSVTGMTIMIIIYNIADTSSRKTVGYRWELNWMNNIDWLSECCQIFNNILIISQPIRFVPIK